MPDTRSAQETWDLRIKVIHDEWRFYGRLRVDDRQRLDKILNSAKEAQRLDPSITTILPLVRRLGKELKRLKQKGKEFGYGDVGKSEKWFDFDHLQQRRADCQVLEQEWDQMMAVATELEAIAVGVLSSPLSTQTVMTRDYLYVRDFERWTQAYGSLGIPLPDSYSLTQLYQSLSVIEMMYREGRVGPEAFKDHIQALYNEAEESAGAWFAFLAHRYGEVMKWKYCFVPRLELDVAEAVAALETELDCSDEERAVIAQDVPVAVQQLGEVRALMSQLLADFIEYDPRERVDVALRQLKVLLEAIQASLESLWKVQVRARAEQHKGMTLAEYYEAWQINP